MATITLQTLGRKLAEKRGKRGIRETAREIGISPATLSRIERGHLPDLGTFSKVCKWLHLDPGDVLASKRIADSTATIAVHFKKNQTLALGTAEALAQMILDAQRTFDRMAEADEDE